MNPLKYQVTAISDVGLSRSLNEDSLLVDGELGLFAIADGMGGHSYGDVASNTVVTHLKEKLLAHVDNRKNTPNQSDHYNDLEEAIDSCNKLILSMNAKEGMPVGSGMGTTLVGLYLLENRNEAVLFNVGDSRVYRLRGTKFAQLTKDHTMYQNWFDSGQKGEAPAKNILINAIGLLDDIKSDLTLEKILPGDVFLICSDGLTTNLADSDLLVSIEKLNEATDAEICIELVAKANDAGGEDNTTIIIVSVAELTVEKELAQVQTSVLSKNSEIRTISGKNEELGQTEKRPAINKNGST